MRKIASWTALALIVAGAGCSMSPRESTAGRATPATPTTRTVLRLPLIDEEGKPFSRFNDRMVSAGLEAFPEYVEVGEGDYDQYWTMWQRIQDAIEKIPEIQEGWGGGMPNDFTDMCFRGDPLEVSDVVGSLTDGFFSDQLGILGSRYGATKSISDGDEEYEEEFGETWATWDAARPEVLMIAVSNDSGDDVTDNVIPPCGEAIDCDVLDDRAMDVCIPDDEADVDVWSCVVADGFAEGHASIELQRYARTCCGLPDADRLWCDDMPATEPTTGPVAHVEAMDLPAGVSSEEGFLRQMKVTVTGGDRFSPLGLARTFTAAQQTFGEECDGVPTGDGVTFSENASVDTFIKFLRTRTLSWTYKMSPAEITGLDTWLHGVGVEKFRIFYGSSSGEVCGGSGTVSYNLVWNVETDEVLYLILYPYSE